MRIGKAMAQASHAAVMATIDSGALGKVWENSPHRTIIVLEGRDELHLRNIREYLEQRGIGVSLIIDEGINEIDGCTVTALATNILYKDDENIVKTMGSFKLYRDSVRLTIEVDK